MWLIWALLLCIAHSHEMWYNLPSVPKPGPHISLRIMYSVYDFELLNIPFLALVAMLGWAWINSVLRKPSDFSRINKKWLPRILWSRHAHEYASEGYRQFNKKLGRPFQMTWWAKENIFLPPEYLQDLKNAEESSLSFMRNLSDAFSLSYSVGNLYDGPLMIQVVRAKLNKNLSAITPILAEEADFAIDVEIGSCKSWTKRNAADVVTRIMHRMTSKILVAPELSRDAGYMSASISFMNSVTVTGLLAIVLPLGPFRGLFVRILALFHRRKLEALVRIVEPLVKKRLQESSSDPMPVHHDAIQWNIELARGDPLELQPRRIALNTLQNLWAGSAGPAVTATQVVFQVLMMPEYQAPLLQEATHAIAEFGWTDKALSQMHLLDSFIGEVNRMYPLGAITAARTVMDDTFTFHDGLKLPKGTRIAFAAGAIQKDERFLNNPNTFNGYRFTVKASGQEGMGVDSAGGIADRAQAASTVTPTNLVFGYGKHACPGRFYAIRKIKIIFCKLALRYEFKWHRVPERRPEDFPVEGQFAANQSQELSFKDLPLVSA